MTHHVEQLNYLAIEFLERLGNIEPTEFQIEIMESILSPIIPGWMTFDKKLNLIEVIYILLAAKGKTSAEIAELLDINERDTENIMKKLNIS